MNITCKDLIWNYLATFLRISSSAILFPFILKMMPIETVGIWTIFVAITAFAALLDFGFSSSFARNVSYVFSGVKYLKKNGHELVNSDNIYVDYGLLKGVISVMKWYYFRVAIVLFIAYTTVGTYYISTLLISYSESKLEIFVSWGILCFIITYNLYTMYYDALLQGKGLIKQSKQILILGQLLYLIVASLLLMFNFGLISIVSAQLISVVVVRVISYKVFYSKELIISLGQVKPRSRNEILEVISPNALKIGLTSLGGFLVNKSSVVLGSLFLTLSEIASYGVTMQIIGIISSLGGIYMMTYLPKVAQFRINKNLDSIKKIYLTAQVLLLFTFLGGGVVLVYLGESVFNLIGSKTPLLSTGMILFSLCISFLEKRHSISGAILLSKNEVPFFKASLYSGLGTILILLVLFEFYELGVITLIISPGIVQAIYQNWKWPLEVKREFNIKLKDLMSVLD